MSTTTRSQKLAQAAYSRVAAHGKLEGEYVSFAKKFPALIHTCGLAQAVAFAFAKKQRDYADDLAAVLQASGHAGVSNGKSLDHNARTVDVSRYLRLARDAIQAASWLKRYAEALGEKD